jgi:glycosyltransferase 2 family protein
LSFILKILNTIFKFLLFFGIGASILYIVFRQQDTAYQAQCAIDGVASADCSLLKKIVQDFGRINYFWIAVVLLCFLISNISRTMRWLMLIRPMGYTPSFINAFLSINVGYFANLGLPRMGEVVRAGSLARYDKIPAEKLMGTIVVDRLIDVLSLLLVIGLAFCLEFNTLWTFLNSKMGQKNGQSVGLLQNPIVQIVLGLGLISGILVLVFRKQLMALSIVQKIKQLAIGFGEGLASIRGVASPFWLLVHSISIWLMYFLMAYFCFKAFPPTAHLGAIVALMVFTFGSFGILIPSPGGMGTYHALVIAALSLYNINGSDAFSFANIFFFSVNIFFNILCGILSVVALPLINKKTT